MGNFKLSEKIMLSVRKKGAGHKVQGARKFKSQIPAPGIRYPAPNRINKLTLKKH